MCTTYRLTTYFFKDASPPSVYPYLGQLQTQVSGVLHGSYIWDLLTECSAGVQNEPVSHFAIHHDNPYTFSFSTRTRQIICFEIKCLEIDARFLKTISI